jgi:hypothetical protein
MWITSRVLSLEEKKCGEKKVGKKKKNMRVSRTGLKKEKQFDNVVEAEELIIAKKKKKKYLR